MNLQIPIAPGPPGEFLFGNLRAFRRDVLGLMLESAREYGDVVRFRLGPLAVHLLSHPDHVEYVLQSAARNYDKATRSSAKISSICGNSLLTSNGDTWKRQRRLMQPSFHRQQVAGMATDMTHLTAGMLASWQGNGQVLDIAAEMMGLTYRIVAKTLMGAEGDGDSSAIEQAITILLAHTYRRWGKVIDWPAYVPTPGNLRFRRALKTVDQIVYRIIEEHRADRSKRNFLATLLGERDEETGDAFSDIDLRNESITFLLAGHETTANALAWTFYLLSQNPSDDERLRAELSAKLGGRAPTAEDLPRLTFTTMVIQESMRLYPPIWALERRAIADDSIGGFSIPAGSSVVISPYVVHRREEFWPDAERFDPTRFNARRRAYFPFGSGQRLCIGSEFAMMEARLIVAMVLQAYRLELLPGEVVSPEPGITLRPKNGLRMRVHPAR